MPCHAFWSDRGGVVVIFSSRRAHPLAPMKNPAEAGLGDVANRDQAWRRRARATPAKLAPSKASMPGSGTAVLC